MKTLFIRIFALLGAFLVSPVFANTGYKLGSFPGCYESKALACSQAPLSQYPGARTTFNGSTNCEVRTSTGSMVGNYGFTSCNIPTPTPSPTPTPNPCSDKTGRQGMFSYDSSEFHQSGKFICDGGCAYTVAGSYVFTTGQPTNPSVNPSCSVQGVHDPVQGCKYYGYITKYGQGKTCGEFYQDYLQNNGLITYVTFDPNGTPPTPAPTSAPTSSPTPPGSGTPAPTAPPSTPVPTPLPPGKCKGTVNGTTVIYDCTNADKDTKTQQTLNSDGSTTTSTTTKDTKCIDDACQTTTTTTTTTKDPNGTQVGSTTITGGTTTQTRKSFCEENPKAAACVGTPDEGFCEQNPQLSVCKDGKWGAGSCGSEPSCSGDEVQCAQARFAFKSYCESKKTSDLLQDLGEKFSPDSNAGAGMPTAISFYTPSYPDGIAGVWASKKDQFNQTPLATLGARLLPNVGEGGQNPSFTFDLDFGGVMNMGTHTLEIDPNIWAIIRAIVLVSALIYAYKMIFGG